jgi:hypothetical protein
LQRTRRAIPPDSLQQTQTNEVTPMKRSLFFTKPTVYLLVVVFSFFSVVVPTARAALVPTAQVVQKTDGEQTRAQLQAMLARADVQAQLEAWGVDPLEAQARVSTLTEQELQTLSAQMEQLPAGGSTLGTIAVVSLIAFLVLLFTDIMGYTDIFPFTH